MTAVTVIIALTISAILRVPVPFTLIVSAIIGITFTEGFNGAILAVGVFSRSLDSYTLVALAMLALAGELTRVMDGEGNLRRVFQTLFAGSHLGPLLVPLLAIVLQGPLLMRSGRSLSIETAHEAIEMLPAMESHGVATYQAWCLIVAGGVSALMLPPGFLPIFMGSAYGLSISSIMLGLLFPGLILLAVFGTLAIYICRQRVTIQATPPIGKPLLLYLWRELEGKGKQFLLPIILLIAIWAGVLTPSEFAAIVASAGFVIAWAQPVRPRLKDVIIALLRASVVTVEFCFIYAACALFLYMVSLTGLSAHLQKFVLVLPPPVIDITTLLFVPLLLACWLDIPVSIMLAALPFGIAQQTGAVNSGPIAAVLILLAILIGAALRACLAPPPLILKQLRQNRFVVLLPWFAALISVWGLIFFVPSIVWQPF